MPIPCSMFDSQRVPDAKPVESAQVNGVVSGWMPTPLPRVTRAPAPSDARVTRGRARVTRWRAGQRAGELRSKRPPESPESNADYWPATTVRTRRLSEDSQSVRAATNASIAATSAGASVKWWAVIPMLSAPSMFSRMSSAKKASSAPIP